VFPDQFSQEEWSDFCASIKNDPYISRFFLRAVILELSDRGFISNAEDINNRLDFSEAVANVNTAERESVLEIFLDCYKQSHRGSSLCKIGSGLPLLIGPGGVSTLYPMPNLCLWPYSHTDSSDQILNCCYLLDKALTSKEWLRFDHEIVQVGPEEACLTAMRFVVSTSLLLDLPLYWAKIEAEGSDPILAIVKLLGELTENRLPPNLWNQKLETSNNAKSLLSGPIPTHTAACTIRSCAEGTYRLTRALLLMMYSLIACNHKSIKSAHRKSIRSNLLPQAVTKLRFLSSLRSSLRSPNSDNSLRLPFANAVRVISLPLSDLAKQSTASENSSELIASFALYSWLAASASPPLLFMRSLQVCGEFDALRSLADAPGVVPSSPNCHFTGICCLEKEDFDLALKCFQNAVCSAETELDDFLSFPFLSLVSDVTSLEISNATDQYWLCVISLFEKRRQSQMVIKAAKLALFSSQNPQIFWSKSFRHNLKLRNYSESYLDILASCDENNGETLVRRLRKFVSEMINQKNSAQLCEFPFVAAHNDVIAEVLFDLGSLSEITDLTPNYYEILYAFHNYRGNYYRATKAIYELCFRLKTESHVLNSLELLEKSLNLALTSLSLVAKEDQFIVIKQTSASAHDNSQSPKRLLNAERMVAAKLEERVVTLEDMKQECALVGARMSLRQVGTLVSGADALMLLVSNHKMFHALFLGQVCELDLSPVFEGFTKRAIQGMPLGDEGDEYADKVSDGKNSWTNLENLMRENDSRKSNFRYFFFLFFFYYYFIYCFFSFLF
jgi:hypothetical protein